MPLEIIGNNNSDLNHIFINFSPVFPLQPPEVEEALGGFLERFGRRLWRLRVTGAEIRIICTEPSHWLAISSSCCYHQHLWIRHPS